MNYTPSAQLIADASKTIVVHDEIGRSITLHRLTALDRLRLFKVLGAELALNTAYLGVAMLAISVSAIDGVPIPPPINEAQVEAIVARLGDEGLTAIADGLGESATPTSELNTAGN